MAIDINKITTDITLEIDEESMSISDYQKASDSFLDLVKEITKNIGQHKASEAWEVRVYSGSVGVGVIPYNGFKDGYRVQGIINQGLEMLSKGLKPLEFTDKAIEHAKGLALSFKSSVAPKIRVWSGKEKSVSIVREIAKTADQLLSPSHEAESSVEGRLETLTTHNGSKFVVYDVIDNRSVSCEIPIEYLDIAHRNFNKRVEVIGVVKFRKDGMPVSVKASKIIPFPNSEEIPSLERMRWLLNGGAIA
jgi:hypothetical protein